jgi:hypothetical protein
LSGNLHTYACVRDVIRAYAERHKT